MINGALEKFSIVDYLESIGFKSFGLDGERIFKVYSETERELESIYGGVGIRNISHIGVLELKGADSIDYLHRITTNDLKNLTKEQIAKTIFTTEKGRVIDLVTLVNFEDFQLILSSNVHKLKVKNWIKKYIVTDEVRVDDAGEKYTILEFLGPQATSFVSMLCGDFVDSLQTNSFKVLNIEGMLFFILKVENYDGTISFITISDFNNGQKIIKYLIEKKSPFNFSFIGEDAYNIYRMGQGIPVAPNEINDEYNPHEAGLAKYISFTKGCFIGQEVIARLQTYDKVQKQLVGVIIDHTSELSLTQMIRSDLGEEVGILTSSCYSPFLKKRIGLAYIKKSFCHPGSQLILDLNPNTQIKIIVSELPFTK